MKNPALSADLGRPAYVAKSDLDLLVHRARTTMRPKRPRGRKKIVLPGFKEAYQAMKRDEREFKEREALRESEAAAQREREENEVGHERD